MMVATLFAVFIVGYVGGLLHGYWITRASYENRKPAPEGEEHPE